MSKKHRKTQSTLASAGSSGKVIATVVAGFVVLVIAITFAWQAEPATPSASIGAPRGEVDRLDVVYFHRSERCESCLWAGQMTRQTMETYFRDELASGRVTFQEVDVQKAENAALVRKYRASGSSLFLNYVKGEVDNIREATDTYPYVGNEARFTALLRAKIRAALRIS